MSPVAGGPDTRCALLSPFADRIALVAATSNRSLDNLWRDVTRQGVALDAAWVLCTNGRELRLVDTQRTYSRAHLQFDLRQASHQPETFAVLWGLLREEAFRDGPGNAPLILEIIRSSARHGQAVSRSLRVGVIESVQHLLGGLDKCGRHNLSRLFDESLIVVYRVLFLMFAESRSLVPNWHPIYRDSYTVESLRDRAERPGKVPGLWEALQAIARLAHNGCRAGSLVVPPFNGRLFSPARAPIAESCAVDDEVARHALLALSTTTSSREHRQRLTPAKRTRIDYRDLGVEQLGAVYESVLDYEPAYADSTRARFCFGAAETSASRPARFTRRRRSPTMSCGAPCIRLSTARPPIAFFSCASWIRPWAAPPFLVSACRYLARAYERALIRDGALAKRISTKPTARMFRRLVAQRCLFGVDLNPTAVQLARLSLWLATLSASKPLTFLDHHLVCGNSLIGASPIDIARQPPGVRAAACT